MSTSLLPPPARRSRGQVLLAIVVALAVLVAVGTYAVRAGWIGGPSTPSTVVGSSPQAEPSEEVGGRRTGLDALISARAAALLSRDRQAWLAGVDESVPGLVEAQGQVFDNLKEVRLSQARLEYAGDGDPLSAQRQQELGPRAWVAKVVFSYRVADADSADVRHEQYLTVRPVPDGSWRVAGTGDGPTSGVQEDLWDIAPVTTHRGARSLVIGTSPDDLPAVARRVDEAAATVDEKWGTGWPRTVVVLVPGTQAELAKLLGRADEAGLDQIAAVTTGEVGVATGQAADRVIVNPATFAGLDDRSAQVVITHEVTHVATRAAGPGAVELWFSEGFSDWVAYSGTGLSRHEVAGELLQSVAAGGDPPSLPTQEDFDPTRRTSVDDAYSAAYLAVDYLERRYGSEAVLQLLRAQAGAQGPNNGPSTPISLQEAMQPTIGTDLAGFEREWQADVRALAADPDG